MLTAPCKDCAERHPGCHSECAKYIEYDKERKDMRESRRRGFDYVACHKDRVSKAARRKWGKRRK